MLLLSGHRQVKDFSGCDEPVLATTRDAVVHADRALESCYVYVQERIQGRLLCQTLISELATIADPLWARRRAASRGPATLFEVPVALGDPRARVAATTARRCLAEGTGEPIPERSARRIARRAPAGGER